MLLRSRLTVPRPVRRTIMSDDLLTRRQEFDMAALEYLITMLQTGSAAQKQQAMQELARFGADAIEPLIQAVVQAGDEDIDGILMGFEYEEDEGQELDPPFSLVDAVLAYDFWYIAAA